MGDVIEAKANTLPWQRTDMTPMEMVSRAVASGASMEVLEKLMVLQERWEKNEARKAFSEAIASAKAEIKPIVKTRDGHNSKYADMAAIADKVDPIISKFGLSYRHRAAQDDKISVTCVIEHKLGHCEETTLSGPADVTGSKNAIQAIGSTLTYLQRYTLMLALGLAAAKDDDGNAASAEETVTAEQIEKIKTRIVEVGADIPSFCKVMKVERVEDVRAKDFDRAMKGLQEVEDWAKSQAKKGAK